MTEDTGTVKVQIVDPEQRVAVDPWQLPYEPKRECAGVFGRLLGHHFVARYNTTPPDNFKLSQFTREEFCEFVDALTSALRGKEMISRRNLLQGIFAAGIAPAIVKAEILMPMRKIIVPEWGIGIASRIQPWQRDMNIRFEHLLFTAQEQTVHWSKRSNPHSFQALLKGTT